MVSVEFVPSETPREMSTGMNLFFTCFHGKRLQVAKEIVTAGLKWAPEMWPRE